MAWTVRTGTTKTDSNGLTINKPTGTTADDVLIANVSAIKNGLVDNAITYPSGWTVEYATTTGSAQSALLTKKAGSSEPSTYTFGVPSGSTGLYMTAAMVAIAGADVSGTLVESKTTATSSSTSTTNTTGSVTPAENGAMIVGAMNNAVSSSGPRGATVDSPFTMKASTISLNIVASAIATYEQATAAAVAPTFESTNTTLTTVYALVLKPASSVTPNELAGRFVAGTDLRGAALVDKPLASRLVAIADLRAALTSVSPNLLSARFEALAELRAHLISQPLNALHARFVAGAGINPTVLLISDNALATRFVAGADLISDLTASSVVLRARFVVGPSLRALAIVDRALNARFEAGADLASAATSDNLLTVRFVPGIWLRENNTGPGSGLVIDGVALEQMIAQLGPGDRLRMTLPWAGITGRTGYARVLNLSIDGSERLTMQAQMVPTTDPESVAAMQDNGGRPRLVIPTKGNLARRQSDTERAVDKLKADN